VGILNGCQGNIVGNGPRLGKNGKKGGTNFLWRRTKKWEGKGTKKKGGTREKDIWGARRHGSAPTITEKEQPVSSNTTARHASRGRKTNNSQGPVIEST